MSEQRRSPHESEIKNIYGMLPAERASPHEPSHHTQPRLQEACFQLSIALRYILGQPKPHCVG